MTTKTSINAKNKGFALATLTADHIKPIVVTALGILQQ